MELYTTLSILYEALLYKVDLQTYYSLIKKYARESLFLSYEFIKSNTLNIMNFSSYMSYLAFGTFMCSKYVPVLNKLFSKDLINLFSSINFLPGFYSVGFSMLLSDIVGTTLYLSNLNQIFTGVMQFLSRVWNKNVNTSYDWVMGYFGENFFDKSWLKVNEEFKNIAKVKSISSLSIFHNLIGCAILSIFAITYGFYLFNKIMELKMINTPLAHRVYKLNKGFNIINVPENNSHPIFFIESSSYTDEEYNEYISED